MAAGDGAGHLRCRRPGNLVGDAREPPRGHAHAPDGMDRPGIRPDAPVVPRGLPHDHGSGTHPVLDCDHRVDCGFGDGAHALWGQAMAAYPGRPFTGVRTREVDYNNCSGALLFGGAHGGAQPGGFDQGRRADGFAARVDHVAARPGDSAGARAARRRGGLPGRFELETFPGHRNAGRGHGPGGLSFS